MVGELLLTMTQMKYTAETKLAWMEFVEVHEMVKSRW